MRIMFIGGFININTTRFNAKTFYTKKREEKSVFLKLIFIVYNASQLASGQYGVYFTGT